jgi:NADPH2:quinone reductase
MRAIVVDRWQDPSELRVSEISEPPLRPGTAKLEMRAAGCNFFDILLVKGQYQHKPPFPFVPGAEVSGVVLEVAPDVNDMRPGDRVFAGVSAGAFAERVVLPSAALRRIPEGMSFEEAAALPVVYPTSYVALVQRAQLRAGETLLVHAAAGGVGLAAVQIGKALGARVIATAGDPEKVGVAQRGGADVGIDYRAEDWVERVRRETGGRGADVIYDSVGGDVFDGSLKCIAWNGRLLVIGFASGRIPEVRVNRILLKNIAVVGLHWGAYAQHEPERIPEAFAALDALYRSGRIRPAIYARYPLDRVPDALAALGSRKSWGKVIVTA